jgi:hypothetical protein
MIRDFTQHLVALRRNNSAWLLLASRNAPLTLACLHALVDGQPDGLPMEDAIEALATTFSEYANDSEFETGRDDEHLSAARRELREWIRRGLVVERGGQVAATDALQRCLEFVAGFEDRAMTSTASRLATVQREIEDLEARLSPTQSRRAESLQRRIDALQRELDAVNRGEFDVLGGQQAVEGIREVYQLAISLRADFRRVEDSYREADLALRQKIIGEKRHRGEVIEELLEAHETLVNTPEGQVFEGFHRQLVQSAELGKMKTRLRSILSNASVDAALARRERRDLRELVPQLVRESQRVIQARAQSERDVRGFIKSGLADEQHRVGAVLQDIFEASLDVDWTLRAVRRIPSPLPPVAVGTGGLPLIERLRVKDGVGDQETDLDFSLSPTDPANLDDEFWRAYQTLDRAALYETTLDRLREQGESMTLAALVAALPPTHDLETLAYWLAMAREAGIPIEAERETFDLFDEHEGWFRFQTPRTNISYGIVKNLNPGDFE